MLPLPLAAEGRGEGGSRGAAVLTLALSPNIAVFTRVYGAYGQEVLVPQGKPEGDSLHLLGNRSNRWIDRPQSAIAMTMPTVAP
jgi:hypothetical protein